MGRRAKDVVMFAVSKETIKELSDERVERKSRWRTGTTGWLVIE